MHSLLYSQAVYFKTFLNVMTGSSPFSLRKFKQNPVAYPPTKFEMSALPSRGRLTLAERHNTCRAASLPASLFEAPHALVHCHRGLEVEGPIVSHFRSESKGN